MRRYGVRALNEAIRQVLEGQFGNVVVEGEVSQLQVPASGHAYLRLREADAQLGAVVWRTEWQRLRHRPEVGERVIARGRISVYAAKGVYQMYVHDLRPAGAGDLAQRIARRRERLEAEGLLDPRRKRPLPAHPRVIGLATSLHGAAVHDFLKVSRHRYPAARVLVAPCTVQGEEAAASVLRAVEMLLQDGRCDVIVVTRGGGSKEDLLPFQDEHLARFLAHSKVPVVSAVGHQVDTTLCDLVADAVAATPSDAAVVALPDGPMLRHRVDELSIGLQAAWARAVGARRERVDALRLRLRHPGDSLAQIRERARTAEGRLHRAALGAITAERSRVRALEASLHALSPVAVLGRGYAIVVGPGGVVTDPAEVASGDALAIRVAGGTVDATVD